MEKHFTINLNGVIIELMVISTENLSEYLKTLTYSERKRFDQLKSDKKKIEFAGSRYLKHLLFGQQEIQYLEHGSPFIKKGASPQLISISHSNTLTGICVHEHFPVAIDIEQVSEKAKKLSSKFISEEEKLNFDVESVEEMTLLWSFKETLYKLSDRNGLVFKEDIRITKNNEGYFGEVKSKTGKIIVALSYIRKNEFYITCNHTFQLLDESTSTN